MLNRLFRVTCLLVIVFSGLAPELYAEINVWAIGDGVRVDPVSGGIIEQMQTSFGPVVSKNYKQENWLWNESGSKVSLKAASNEVVSFQLVIESDACVKGLNLVATSLAGPDQAIIPASSVKMFRQWYHYLSVSLNNRGVLFPLKSGWYPDALIPLDAAKHGAPFDIPGEDFYSIDEQGAPLQRLTCQTNQAVWVDLYVPDSTLPGTYSGELAVTAGGRTIKTIKVRLEVFGFTIPDEIHTTWEFMDYGRVSHGPEELELKTWRLAQSHRVTLSSTSMMPELVGEGYDVIIDWQDYDRRWGKFLDGSAFVEGPGKGQPVKHVLLPFDVRVWRQDHNNQGWRSRDWPFPLAGDSTNQHISPEYKKAFLRNLKEFEKHFKKKGWDKTRMLLWMDGVDEPGTNSGEVGLKPMRLLRQFGELVKGAGLKRIKHRVDIGSGLNTVVDLDGDGQLPEEPQTEVIEYLKDAVDIWNCAGNCLVPELLNMKPGTRWTDVWFYNGFVPSIGCGLINGESLGFRTWQWIAWKYRVGGACDWEFGLTKGLDNAFRQIKTDPRNMIMYNRTLYIYPGEHIGLEGEPIPSIRLKMIRRSLQDYEYLWLLAQKENGRAAADRVVDKVLDRGLREARPVRSKTMEADPGYWSHKPEEWYNARVELGQLIGGAD